MPRLATLDNKGATLSPRWATRADLRGSLNDGVPEAIQTSFERLRNGGLGTTTRPQHSTTAYCSSSAESCSTATSTRVAASSTSSRCITTPASAVGPVLPGSGAAAYRAVDVAGSRGYVQAPPLTRKVVAPEYPVQRSLDLEDELLPLSQILHQKSGSQIVTGGAAKQGVGAGIPTTRGLGKKAPSVVQQPVLIKPQDFLPFGRALERSCETAMLKPTTAKRPAASKAQPPAAKRPDASKAPPTAAEQLAASQSQRAVVVVESGSSASASELEVGEGRGTAQEPGQLMESNLVKRI